MPAPFKNTVNFTIGNTHADFPVCVYNVEVRAIEWVSGSDITGGNFYLKGASITDQSGSRGNAPANSTFSEVFDTNGARVSFTKQAGKIVVLSEAQRFHFSGAHYVLLVSGSPQASAAGQVNLIGVSLYR